MKISAIRQQFNSKTIEGRGFQQNPTVAPANHMPKSDTLSFGMANIVDVAKLRAASKRFIFHITSSSAEEAREFIESLKPQQPEFKNAFALLRDKDLDTHFNIALVNKRPEIANVFLEFVTTLDAAVQRKFASLKGSDEISQFNYALECNYPESALKFLDFAASAAPKEVLKYIIPENIAKSDAFVSVAGKIAKSKELTPDEQLRFLSKNNHNSKLDEIIQSVQSI